MDGEFFKLKGKEKYRFTRNPCVHFLESFSITSSPKERRKDGGERREERGERMTLILRF